MARVAAPEGLVKLEQRSFEAGAFPGDGVAVATSVGMDRIPPNGCADIVNGLVDEDGSIFRRGGSAYVGTKAASNTQPWMNLWSGFLGSVGQVDIASRIEDTPISHQKFYSMFPGDTDWVFRWSDLTSIPEQRITAFGGMAMFVAPAIGTGAGVQVSAWGGSTAAAVTGQTLTLTKDSKTVTGGASSFLSAAPGAIITAPGLFDRVAVVESIQSNTQLTLLRPWPVDSIIAGTGYSLAPTVSFTSATNILTAGQGGVYASSIGDRVVYGRANRLAMTLPGDSFSTYSDEYHELPAGVSIIGLEPLRDQLLVFTTHGVFVISGMAFELTDAVGNPQQRLERVAPDIVLWDNRGIGAWQGGVIAPCSDDIYVIDSAASMRPIAGGMRGLYRSYVNAGHSTGVAQVFGHHYVLPIHTTVANTVPPVWVDTLVCDLRTGAWTRWADHGGTVRGLTRKVGDNARQPQLLASSLSGAAPRILDLSAAFNPTAAAKQDADGTVHKLRVVTRTWDLGDLIEHTWRKVRLRMELEDAASDDPHMEAYSEKGRLSPTDTDLVDDVGEGEQIYTWPVREHARGVRFVFTQWSAAARARIRAIDVFVRRSEKL